MDRVDETLKKRKIAIFKKKRQDTKLRTDVIKKDSLQRHTVKYEIIMNGVGINLL